MFRCLIKAVWWWSAEEMKRPASWFFHKTSSSTLNNKYTLATRLARWYWSDRWNQSPQDCLCHSFTVAGKASTVYSGRFGLYLYIQKMCHLWDGPCLTLTLEILFFFKKSIYFHGAVWLFYNQWSHLVKNNLGNFNLGNLGNWVAARNDNVGMIKVKCTWMLKCKARRWSLFENSSNLL